MKLTNYPHYQTRRGSVLLIVMGTVIVLGTALAAVLSLTTHEQRIIARTSTWNAALPVAEAGVEEAMSHLRQVGDGNRAANGWQADGSSFVMTRTNLLSDSRYVVAISNATPPVILSRGEVWCPSAGRYISRTIQATTTRQATGSGGINARGVITFSGSGHLDSYDSSEGPYDVTRRRANGLAISNLGTAGAIRVGTGKIYGKAKTAPGGTVTFGAGGAVGDLAWIAGGNVGAQTNTIGSDANVEYSVPPAPFVFGTAMSPVGTGGVISGFGTTNWLYALGDGDYNLASVSVGNGANPMLVMGKARLYVSSDFKTSGSGYVYIAPGASLELFVGRDFNITGGGVFNGTGRPQNLTVSGLSTTATRSWAYSGGASLVGQVNAPVINTFVLSGGASAFGSFTANNFTLSGGGSIHFDESLGASGNLRIASWNEL